MNVSKQPRNKKNIVYTMYIYIQHIHTYIIYLYTHIIAYHIYIYIYAERRKKGGAAVLFDRLNSELQTFTRRLSLKKPTTSRSQNLTHAPNNLIAMASDLIAMASNLMAIDGLEPNNDGLKI